MTDQPFPLPSPLSEDDLKIMSKEQIFSLMKDIQTNCQQVVAYSQAHAKNAGIIRDYMQKISKI